LPESIKRARADADISTVDTAANPQLKRIVIGGGLAVVALLAGMFFMSRQSSAAAESSLAPRPLNRINPAPAPKAPAAPAKAKAAPAAKAKAPAAKANAKPAAAKPKPVAKPKPAPVENPNGLPLDIARALMRNPVVVVSLYTPDGTVDDVAAGEAQAGAKEARAAFVALDVHDDRQVSALTKQMGVLEAPAVLIYTRPGTLAAHLEGFYDRDTVAQAVANVGT